MPYGQWAKIAKSRLCRYFGVKFCQGADCRFCHLLGYQASEWRWYVEICGDTWDICSRFLFLLSIFRLWLLLRIRRLFFYCFFQVDPGFTPASVRRRIVSWCAGGSSQKYQKTAYDMFHEINYSCQALSCFLLRSAPYSVCRILVLSWYLEHSCKDGRELQATSDKNNAAGRCGMGSHWACTTMQWKFLSC